MGEEELFELQEIVSELAEFVRVEALPVEALPLEALPLEALPVYAATWFARLLRLFARHAYLLAFLGALIENTIILGFLLPGGAMVALSAAGGRTAGSSLPVLVLLAASGMTCGAVIDYLLGRAGADRLLRRSWAGRFGARLADQLERAAPVLRRHGWWVMLVAHAFGHGRSSLALAAGASHLPLRRFLTIEAPAALLWSVLYASGGYFLAAEWQTLELAMRRLGWLGAAIVMIGALGWWYVHRRHSPPPAADKTDDAPATYKGSRLSVGASAPSEAPAPVPLKAMTQPRGPT